ncbi:MAG: hypothetical protein J0L75_07230 [Spirochaetes bacterium]|nr:hypothetical protein [Spirochaetota bacterium]
MRYPLQDLKRFSPPATLCALLLIPLSCSVFEPPANPKAIGEVPVFAFPTNAPWARRIPAGAPVDPDSSAYVARLVAERAPDSPYAETENDGVAVYYAEASTARRFLPIRNQGDRRRGVKSVPLPDWALPNGGTDSHLALIDVSSGLSFEFWRLVNVRGEWACGNAALFDLSGDGVNPYISARASGFSLLAGVVWPQELQAGRIPHALALSVPSIRKSGPVSPASYTDGRIDAADALPMGALLQLDPSLDLGALGLDSTRMALFRALQEYGGYVCDTGALSIQFINRRSFSTDPYSGLPAYDSRTHRFDLNLFPVEKLRVLKLGAPGTNRDGFDHEAWYE